MKTYARLIAAAGIASALAAPLPAGAAGDAWITVQHAPSGATEAEARQWTPRPGAILRGQWKVVVDGGAPSSLRSFDVAIRPEDPNTPTPQAGSQISRTYAASQKGSDRIEIAWDTDTLTPFNAYYQVVATAVSWIDGRQDVSVTRLAVDNQPEVPAGVEAVLDGAVARVSWRANADLDLRGYRILRSTGTLPFKQIASTTKTTFADADAPQGVALRYQVVAFRASVLDQNGVASAPSKATPPLTIAAAAAAGGPKVPVEIPAAAAPAAVQARAKETVLPRRDLGFAPLLPYTQPLPQPAAEEKAKEEPPGLGFVSLPSVVRGARMVYKPPFVASALLLLVAALHVAMAARRLLRAA